MAVGAASVALNLIGMAIPLVGANLTFLVALLFLFVPGFFLKRRGERDYDYGLDLADGWRGAGVGLLATFITLALFLPAQHLWATQVEARAFHFDLGNYRRASEKYFGPPQGAAGPHVDAWTYGPQVHLRWLPNAGPWSLEVRSVDGSATLADSPAALAAGELRNHVVVRGNAVHEVRLSVHSVGAPALNVRATSAGAAVAADSYRNASGRAISSAGDHATIRMNYWWIASLALTQFLLVAIPEEFFYRGYVQKRVQQAMAPKAWRILGLKLTWPIVITSAIFAVGHLFIGFGAHRLLVFFPSLVFGMLREKTGGIVAPAVYHAGCNLMVYAAAVHYF